MASGKAKMKILQEQRDRLLAEMEALRNKIAGLEMAMSLLNNEPVPGGNRVAGSSSRVNLKGTILEFLEQTGTTGVNAQTVVEMARLRGVELDKNSVSSNLSRFKRDGIVIYDGERYKLKQFARAAAGYQPSAVN